MKCRKAALLLSIGSMTLLFLVAPSLAQRDLGNYTVSGEIEVGGQVRHKSGNDTKFEEYRDLPETMVSLNSSFSSTAKRTIFIWSSAPSNPA